MDSGQRALDRCNGIRPSSQCDGYVDRCEDDRMDVLVDKYGPAEKKAIRVMVPVSKIIDWFKRRNK